MKFERFWDDNRNPITLRKESDNHVCKRPSFNDVEVAFPNGMRQLINKKFREKYLYCFDYLPEIQEKL